MIIVRLVGGLGNQMFQYASALAVAKASNTKLAMDTSWFTTNNSVAAPREYELDCFMLTSPVIKPSAYAVVANDGRAGLRSLLKRNKVREYREKSMRFDPDLLAAGSDLVLDGYWQSEQYFASIRPDILSEFSFNFKPSKQNAKVAEQIAATNAVSLHVRRGDYAAHANTNATHGLMGLDYYKAAIASLAKRVKNPHFFVFSDEPEWCRQNLPIKQPHTFVSGNKKGCFDMQLMAICNHHIIANSSFSWWGAWLNDKPGKLVIAPKRWFTDPTMDATDVVPKTWERI